MSFMNKIKLLSFDQVDPEDLLLVVNDQVLRAHLVDHAYFDSVTINDWMNGKVQMDSMPGCRIRAVFIGEILAGWCGVQSDGNAFEIAIVISKQFWGLGISIFSTLIGWSKELGHREFRFHLLDTRPEYKVIKKLATKVLKTELMGRHFTTYIISIDNWRNE